MSDTEKQDFTKEIKIAYRNYSVGYNSGLLVGLIMEITASNRGKLFVLRDKDGTPVYSYFISPLSSQLGAVKDSHELERTVKLGVPEIKVAKTIIEKINDYGIGNIGACVVIDSLIDASFDFLYPFVQIVFEDWTDEFRHQVIQELKSVLFGEQQVEIIIDGIKAELRKDLNKLVQLYHDLYGGRIMVSDLDDYVLCNISKAVVWFIEQEYGVAF